MNRTLNENEIVWLNSNNAAAGDGIYRAEWRGNDSIAVPLMIISIPFLAIFMYGTAKYIYYAFIFYGPPKIESTGELLDYLGLLGIFLFLDSLPLFGIVKAIKELKKKDKSRELVGHLLIPWSEVKTIVITNVRQVGWVHGWNSNMVDQQIYQEMVGDWHVFSKDGKEITIPNVSDPYNKLNYVKTRFNLQF